MDTTNKPVAWLVQYRDRHEFRWSKPEHLAEDVRCEPLYTHPNQHDLGIAEAIEFDRGYQAATARSQEPDSYGDGTVYRGVRSGDSEVKTYVFDEHAGKQTWSVPARELTYDFIYKNHMGYVSPDGAFYAPDYPTWKEDGFTPVYREPVVAKTLTDEEFDNIFANGKRLGVLETEDRFRKAMNLTDEEICKIFNEHTGLGIRQKEADKADLLVFARALLRKAQE
jgi:hypothetical protein